MSRRPALAALAKVRRVAVDDRAGELEAARGRLEAAQALQLRAEETFRQSSLTAGLEVAAELTHLASGRARVVDLIRQELYQSRRNSELVELRRARDEARRRVARELLEFEQARSGLVEAYGERQAVEGRLHERARLAAGRSEREREEAALEDCAARWSGRS